MVDIFNDATLESEHEDQSDIRLLMRRAIQDEAAYSSQENAHELRKMFKKAMKKEFKQLRKTLKSEMSKKGKKGKGKKKKSKKKNSNKKNSNKWDELFMKSAELAVENAIPAYVRRWETKGGNHGG